MARIFGVTARRLALAVAVTALVLGGFAATSHDDAEALGIIVFDTPPSETRAP